MKKYINPTIEIVKVDLLSALCNGSGVKGEGIQGDSGIPAPARKLYV
ncbi:MAG: hypothetical protein MJZ65_02080 [Paludibacteraceae bacterium]|nr:hypothetical protein [Paludibacteraceae bacterium]